MTKPAAASTIPAQRAVAALRSAGATVSVAESLTGGAVAVALTDVPGASAVFRGGVVAYATPLKALLLGVDADLLAHAGAVNGDVAVQMAEGVRSRLVSTYGVATTGVAGPDEQDGCPPGTAFVAVAGPAGVEVRPVRLTGDRAAVRLQTVVLALDMVLDMVEDREATS